MTLDEQRGQCLAEIQTAVADLGGPSDVAYAEGWLSDVALVFENVTHGGQVVASLPTVRVVDARGNLRRNHTGAPLSIAEHIANTVNTHPRDPRKWQVAPASRGH